MRIVKLLLATSVFFFGSVGSSAADDADYWTARIDYRRCMYPMCGGYWVKRVNHGLTRCSDGQFREECYVVELDWSGSDISERQISEIEGVIGTVILSGDLEDMTFEDLDTTFDKLAVTRVYRGATGKDTSGLIQGRFVRLTGDQIVCITTPCVSPIDEAFLNRRLSFPIQIVDLSPSKATEEQIASGMNAVFEDDYGLLAFGTNSLFWDNDRIGIQFSATEFFLKVTPDKCRPTGCSGQICSNGEVVTTCEWLPEYACIKRQVCETQSDGSCGWTPTDESKICFENL